MDNLMTAMALLRGLHMAATLSMLGTAGFLAWMLPATAVVPGRLTWLWWVSGAIALTAGVAWFAVQAAIIAGVGSIADWYDAYPLVAGHTRFGSVMMLRLGLLLVATGLAWFWPPAAGVDGSPSPVTTNPVATIGGCWRVVAGGRGPLYLSIVLTAIALALQGRIGHAGATAGSVGDGLVLSESLHLFAAGIWLGALLPLWLTLLTLSPAQAAAMCERFSPIGLACVLVLAGTGITQAVALIGGVPALFGTMYGLILLLKIALFLFTLMLAAYNRLWLTDRLTASAIGARSRLLRSVSIETGAGLALVLAAAFLASQPPAAHVTPVWPFPWQFSLHKINADPSVRQQVALSLIAIGVAVALMVAAQSARRLHSAALTILAVTLVVRGPSVALLTAEAYPASFQTSPTDFAAASIVRGQILFAENCAACHGANGDGNGSAAAASRIKPADLTMPHVREHSDGEMFWWLTHGIDDPGGGLAMPGFGALLSRDDRWALIDYVRAHNAGVAMQADAMFQAPVRAPAMALTCAGLSAANIADLRGRTVHAITEQAPEEPGEYAVTVDLNDGAAPPAGGCAAVDPTARDAYAILAGMPLATLTGTEFLIDPDGWLRAIHRVRTPGGWHTRDELTEAISGLRANPIHQHTEGQNDHHH